MKKVAVKRRRERKKFVLKQTCSSLALSLSQFHRTTLFYSLSVIGPLSYCSTLSLSLSLSYRSTLPLNGNLAHSLNHSNSTFVFSCFLSLSLLRTHFSNSHDRFCFHNLSLYFLTKDCVNSYSIYRGSVIYIKRERERERVRGSG